MSATENQNKNQPENQNARHDEHALPQDLPHLSRVQIVAALLVFVALLGACFFIGWNSHRKQEVAANRDVEERNKQVQKTNVVRVRESGQVGDVTLPCDVRPDQETAIFPRTSGYLKRQLVDIGDQVKTGQLLAEIDTPEVDAQLAQSRATLEEAKAAVNKAQADLRLAEVTLRRFKETERTASGVVSAIEMEQKQAAYDQAVAILNQAKASVVAQEANVGRLVVLQGFEKVTAPFDGIITARNYDVGALLSASNASPASAMFRITASTTMRVYVNVPQVYASQIALGQKAQLTVRNFPSRQFEGHIFLASKSIDASTRTMLFVATFENPDGVLFPGMYGQLNLSIKAAEPTLIVPTSAMIFNTQGTQVAVVRDGRIQMKNVVVGRDLGTELEVTKGLLPNDLVVATPDARTRDGAEVQVNEKAVAAK